MLMELLRREKDLGIEPDDDLDTFVKVCISGKKFLNPVVSCIIIYVFSDTTVLFFSSQ